MIKLRRLIYILAICIVSVSFIKFSYIYLIGQEGMKYFSIIKGVVQLNITDEKIIKLSDNPEEYIFKTENEDEIEQMP